MIKKYNSKWTSKKLIIKSSRNLIPNQFNLKGRNREKNQFENLPKQMVIKRTNIKFERKKIIE
jgi:hypothetical protein